MCGSEKSAVEAGELLKLRFTLKENKGIF